MDYGMDYQGQSGGGDGGFNNAGGGGQSQYTPSQTQGGGGGGTQRRAYDEQTVIPVTASMALVATPDLSDEQGGGVLQLEDGRKIFHVRLVGAVRSFQSMSTNVVYSIEDGTGLINVKQWHDDSEVPALTELREKTLQDNIYVKVVGQLKDYNGEKTIVASSVRPLSTGNELTHHFLEVVYSSENYKRKEKSGGGIGGPSPMLLSSPGGGGGVYGGSKMGGGGGALVAQSGSGQDALSAEVAEYVKVEGDKTDIGVTRQDIIDVITQKGGYSIAKVSAAVDALASDGHLYTTINEESFKCAM